MADDIASQWKTFDAAKRQRLLQRMSPEQKKSLRASLEGKSAAAAPPAKTAPPPNSVIGGAARRVGDLLKGGAQTFFGAPQPDENIVTSTPAYRIGKGIVLSGKQALHQAGEQFHDARAIAPGNPAIKSLEYLRAATTAISAFDPLASSAVTNINQLQDEGRSREALGQGTVDALTLVGPELVKKAAGTPEVLRRTTQKVLGVGTRPLVDEATKAADTGVKVQEKNAGTLKNDVSKRVEALKSNRAEVAQHVEKTAETKVENSQNVKAHQNRAARQAELDKVSKELDQRYEAAEKKANADNDAAWEKVRAKVGNEQADIGPLKQAVEIAAEKADPTTSPIFKSILREDSSEAHPVYADHQPVNPGEANYERYYEMQYGEPPPIGGAGTATFARLQRWYSYLGDRLYSGGGRMEAGQYNALKLVRDRVDDAMQQIAEKTKASDELTKARKMHTEKMETFSDSPNQAATVASKSLAETTPDYVKEQARAERLKKVAKYDPTIGKLASHAENLQKGIKALPKETPLRNQVKALPERPGQFKMPGFTELEPKPEFDLQKERQALIQKAASRWRQTSQYSIRRLGVSAISGAVAVFTGHPLGAGPAGYVTAEFLPKGLAAIVEKPRVMEWLSSPSEEDIRALREIPNIDQVHVIDGLTGLAVDQARSGHPVTLGAAAVQLLGPANVARIHAAQVPANAGEAKRRAKALQPSP